MQNFSGCAISDREIELQANDLRQILEAECGGVPPVTIQRCSDPQDKLAGALLEVNLCGIYTHTHTYT